MLTLTDISTLWVLGDVYERDLGQVRTGQTADIATDAYPGETFRGRITYISDAIALYRWIEERRVPKNK